MVCWGCAGCGGMCRLRVSGAQYLAYWGCAGCCRGRLTVFAVHTPLSTGRPYPPPPVPRRPRQRALPTQLLPVRHTHRHGGISLPPRGTGAVNSPAGLGTGQPRPARPSRVGPDRRADHPPTRPAQALSQTKPTPPPSGRWPLAAGRAHADTCGGPWGGGVRVARRAPPPQHTQGRRDKQGTAKRRPECTRSRWVQSRTKTEACPACTRHLSATQRQQQCSHPSIPMTGTASGSSAQPEADTHTHRHGGISLSPAPS